ncbi:MAG TPA: FAD-dependent oxidoreductase [Steroidobacteraceae bacterium]|nr:FAD-dependent oxidoreductase [Steroidobacteraceae bacterium]
MNARAHGSIGRDRASVAGKQPPIDDSTDLLIIGAGHAGISAALTAAGCGVRVTLVDENPVPLTTMGEDVPLHFGGRVAATAANHNAVLETILRARPQLAEVIDAGVDVRLGTAAWGLFPNRPTAAWIDGHVAGLADEHRAYLMRFEQVIVAAGCRDMGLAFDGWHRPGVMGALAAYRLATDYEALDARVAVLVGSGTETLQIGNALSEAGIRVAAVIEQAAAIAGPQELASRLLEGGTRLLTSHVIEQALSDAQGVAAVRLARVDAQGHRVCEALERIECDTLVLGIAAVPALELLEATGCAISYQAERGGHVALIDGSQRTSLPFVYAAGDCAGIWPSKTLSDATARREGRIAALAALRSLGAKCDGRKEEPVSPDAAGGGLDAQRLGWVRATTLRSAASPFVCQCEEVTAADILELNPPRYLRWRRPSPATQGLCTVDAQRAPDPDVVKRLTRAGMGPCQGRRCREQIAALMALASGAVLPDIPLATHRPPVRPLRLSQLAALPEAAAMGDGWESWFGIAAQWVPYWRVPPESRACAGGKHEAVSGE